jgi:predicted DNA-binding ribbon-helix-helix protein
MAKHSITIAGHRTSVSIEQPFWQALGEIAAERKSGLATIIAEIDRSRPAGTNLSSAIRLYVLDWFRGNSADR